MPIGTNASDTAAKAGATQADVRGPGQTWRLAIGALAILAVPTIMTAAAEPLAPQPVFESRNGVLDVLMVAKPKAVELAGLSTTAWVYEICRRPKGGGNACPSGAGTENPYGGTRLQLQPGDRLRIRLVNALPALTCADAKHAASNDIGAELLGNPTNLHTHGLIVEPRRATPARPTYGDYVYVVVQNPANPMPSTPCAPPAPATAARVGHAAAPSPAAPGHQHGHGSITDVAQGAVEYDIRLPRRHPAGLFWFHPHAHGLALNQVSAGLAGSLTVGGVRDYLCDEPGCTAYSGRAAVRYLMLKDSQIEKSPQSERSGALLTQQDPGFCDPQPSAGEPPRQGFCPGTAAHPGGRWVHSVNGQVYPEVDVGGSGEVWRITNAAGSRSYALSIDDHGQPLVVQVLSIDGVALDVPRGTTLPAMRSMLGPKVDVVGCPHRAAPPAGIRRDRRETEPVCAIGLRMMPSARVELWVARHEAGQGGKLAVAAEPAQAILRTAVYSTGDDPANAGDNWPAIDLAAVTFRPESQGIAAPVAPASMGVRTQAAGLLRPDGALVAAPKLLMAGAEQPVGIAAARDLASRKTAAGPPVGLALAPSGGVNAISPEARLGLGQDLLCRTLPTDHRRRIFFGKLQPNTDTFGLGYEEVDAHGAVVPGTEQPITAFNPAQVSVCVRLPLVQPGRDGYQETWELVNLTNEDHNFHVHQTRFQLVESVPASPGALPGGVVLQDNVPLLHGNAQPGAAEGCDGTVSTWRSAPGEPPASCLSPAVVVRTPFSQIGDFVYHCHILEHEDGGMMARIRVMPAFALN